MKRYALTIFVSAFLLFQVQPLIGKFILPWFGSSSGVWTTALLFFQVSLLAGYAYAHLVATRLPVRYQAILHLVLLGGAAALLPIIPSEAWKPAAGDDPIRRILVLLAVTVGAPFFVLSATSPLLQRWFARTRSGRSPYRLYAVSNAGSLLALLSYPLIVERTLRLPSQAWTWSAAFLVFVVLSAACARDLWAQAEDPAAGGGRAPVASTDDKTPGLAQVVSWLILATCGSVMLMATIHRMGQDVPAVPFLFVLPLAVYLLTFIITFDHERWYHRPSFCVLLLAGVAGALLLNRDWSLVTQISVYSLALFACCMSCHGELVRAKPHPSHLTLFYMMVALGGAAGGVLVALVAPVWFLDFWEYEIGLFASLGVVMLLVGRDLLRAGGHRRRLAVGALALGILALGAMLWRTGSHIAFEPEEVIRRARNFYGVLKVVEAETANPRIHNYALYHGGIRHGFQYRHPDKRRWPTAYFVARSGVGIALRNHPRIGRSDRPFRIGVIGLGVGTLATYSERSTYLRFYEINPEVVRFAEEEFTFLSDARARGVDLGVLEGDARIVLERQLRQNGPERFDLLAVDAFSGDTIPMHLLTRECFEIYLAHMAPDGILVFQATNLYLDLYPVIRALADGKRLRALDIFYPGDPYGGLASRWIVVTNNEAFLGASEVRQAAAPEAAGEPVLWTDDFSSLLPLIVD